MTHPSVTQSDRSVAEASMSARGGDRRGAGASAPDTKWRGQLFARNESHLWISIFEVGTYCRAPSKRENAKFVAWGDGISYCAARPSIAPSACDIAARVS